MDLTRDVHSPTASSRGATAFLRQLKQSGPPLVLSVDGKAEAEVHQGASRGGQATDNISRRRWTGQRVVLVSAKVSCLLLGPQNHDRFLRHETAGEPAAEECGGQGRGTEKGHRE